MRSRKTDKVRGSDLHSSMRIAAVVLAGGKGSRYGGVAKGLLEPSPGVCILEGTIAEIRSSGIERIAISANDADPYAAFGLTVIPDLRPGLGPIGGIEAGLAHFRSEEYGAVLFLPCDLPAITRQEISKLISKFSESGAHAVYAQDGSFFDHPLCAVVHIALLDDVTGLIDEGHRKIADAWARLGAAPVPFEDAAPFYNVNTPADFARWKGEPLLPTTILVPENLVEEIKALIRSEGLPLEIVREGQADLRVARSERRVESDDSTLHTGGWIRCPVARDIGARLGIDSRQFGKLLNALDIRVRDCELGCF